MSLTWLGFTKRNDFQSITIECPVTGDHIAAIDFGEQYEATLKTFDGEDNVSWFDLYFQQSPVIYNRWVYKNNSKKQDFIDLCMEDGCMDNLQLEREGWSSQKEKDEHQRKERQRERQQAKKAARQCNIDKNAKIRQSLLASIRKTENDLDDKFSTDKAQKLERMKMRLNAL